MAAGSIIKPTLLPYSINISFLERVKKYWQGENLGLLFIILHNPVDLPTEYK